MLEKNMEKNMEHVMHRCGYCMPMCMYEMIAARAKAKVKRKNI